MASSTASSAKSSSITAAQSPDHPQGLGRRTPRSSVPSSPEHHHQAPQRKPLARSSSDSSKMSKPPPSVATSAAKRQPLRKPIERSSSLKVTAPQTTVKERATRTGPSTVARPTISAKPSVEKASTSKVATRTAARTQPVSKAKSVGVLTKKKEVGSSNTANKNEKPAVIVSEHESKETSPKIEDIEDDTLNKQLDEISEQYVSEFTDDTATSEQLELHANSIADDVDEELNNVHDSEEKEEGINNSENAMETTVAETTEDNKMELVQHSETVELHAENNAELVHLSSETAETKEKEIVNVVNTDSVEGAASTSATAKKSEIVQGMKTETPKSNEVIEETRNKLLEHRKSKVKALVGAFETVMS